MGYYIEVKRGVKIYVEDIGKGKPVLFIHGWPINHLMYEYQINQLPKYGYRCILPDLRGFGQSDRPWHGYSYDSMADDIKVIVAALGFLPMPMVGFSMGGAIAIRYMRRHHGFGICKLILAGAAAPSFTQRKGYPYGMTKEAVDALIRQNDTDRPQMLTDFGQMFFYQKISPSFRNWFHSLGLSAASHATAATAVSLRDEDLRPDLPAVQVPTTILHGVHDQICPFPLAQLMHRGIQHSQLIPFYESGHGLFYDELDKFNHCLLQVLGG